MMTSVRLCMALVWGFCVLLPWSHAAEIHVSPEGDDGAPGTVEAPLATLQQALERARAGDVVLLHDGTYAESVAAELRGTRTDPIVLRAAEGAQVIFDGSGLTDPAIDLQRSHYVRIEGLTLQGYQAGGVLIGAGGAPWDRSLMRTDSMPAVSLELLAQGNALVDCTVRDCGRFGVSIRVARRTSIQGCTIEQSGTEGSIDLAELADHSLIKGNTITGGLGPGILVRGGSSFCSIVENRISECAQAGVEIESHGWKNIIGRNISEQNTREGYIGTGTINTAWVWNVAHGNQGAGISLQGEGTRLSYDNSVIGCVSVRNAGPGLEIGGAVDSVIRENILSQNTGPQLRISPAAAIRGGYNIDYNCLYAGAGLAPTIAWATDEAELTTAGLARDYGVGPSNLSEDPLFPQGPTDWGLSGASPCVAAGPGGENLGVNPVTPLPEDVPAPDDAPNAVRATDPVQLVRESLGAQEGLLAATAARVARRAAETRSDVLDIEALRPDLARLVAPGEASERVRWQAIRALAAMDDASVEYHVEHVQEAWGRVQAALAARVMPQGRRARFLDQARASLDPWVHTIGLATAAIDDPVAADDLVFALDDVPVHAYLLGAITLRVLQHPDGGYLFGALADRLVDSPELQDAARALLEESLVPAGALAVYLPPPDGSSLDSPDGLLRAEAYVALAVSGGPDAEQALTTALSADPSPLGRLAALAALIELRAAPGAATMQ